MPIEVGTRTTWERRVEVDMTADRWGNKGVMVLATPHLVGLLEATSVRAIAASFHLDSMTVIWANDLANPELREKIVSSGFLVQAKTGEEHMARLVREVPMFRDIIKRAGIKAM